MIPLSGDIPNTKGIIHDDVDSSKITRGSSTLKRGFAHMLKNGVVMDVTTAVSYTHLTLPTNREV